jgi:Peptidase family C25/Propeptide_C25
LQGFFLLARFNLGSKFACNYYKKVRILFMKKALLLIFVLSTILMFASIIEHTYYFNDLQISDSEGYQLVNFENTQSAGIIGEPTLPYHAVQLLLPHGEIAESILISGSNEIQLNRDIELYPMQQSKPLSSNEPSIFQKKDTIYQSDQNYPVEQHGRLTTEFMNGYGFALSTISPVNYIPATKQLSYFREVTVEIETKRDPNMYSRSKTISSRQKVLDKINSFAQNSELISSYNTDITREGEYEILIITPNQFSTEFDAWINLNQQKGMRSEIATTEDINATMAGQDLQEKIRNYIIQEYSNNDVVFVLLAGDAEHVPPRGFYCYVESGDGVEDYAIPADVYYSGLDGSWNDDGDNLWAEPGEDDLLPDISVGRLPFSNSTELATMLGKSFSYQIDPVLDEMQNTLLVGEHMYDDPLTWGGDYMDLLVGWHDDYGYTTDGIPEDHSFEEMYDRDLGTWNVQQLMTEINEGKPFIYHAGHCNYSYNMRMSTEDITNTNFSQVNGVDHNFSIIYSHGCNCAGFDEDDCIAEDMLKIDNFAVTFVGNSRYGWFNEGQTEGPSGHLNREFTDALYTDKTDLIAQTPWNLR